MLAEIRKLSRVNRLSRFLSDSRALACSPLPQRRYTPRGGVPRSPCSWFPDTDLAVARFILIGSGLAGGLLAAYLGRRGYDVDLYERRADPREGNIVGGRSINLAISTRGIHALEQIGIADEALRHAIPMRGRMIHDKSGALHFAPYDVDPKKCINSIGRASLNTAVIEAAQRYPNVRVHFNHKCTDVDLTESGLPF